MFNAEEKEKLKNITILYRIVKEVVIHAEEVEVEADPQVINELRHALDHLMRVTAYKFNIIIGSEFEDDYVKRNLDKAYGHIYRAGYDTLDLLCLILRGDIAAEVEQFPLETINNVFPAYYNEINTSVEGITKEIITVRVNKDVGRDNFENFMHYVELTKRLIEHKETVLNKLNPMIKYTEKRNEERTREKITTFALGVLVAIIGGIIVWLLSSMF